jgi:hypothetical protein
MTKPFASQADLAGKKTSFIELSDNAYAYNRGNVGQRL